MRRLTVVRGAWDQVGEVSQQGQTRHPIHTHTHTLLQEGQHSRDVTQLPSPALPAPKSLSGSCSFHRRQNMWPQLLLLPGHPCVRPRALAL